MSNSITSPKCQQDAHKEDPVLIEIDARIIRDLVALTAMALQIATGSRTAAFPASDAIPYLNARNAAPGANTGASA